jgi:hypothetical protein
MPSLSRFFRSLGRWSAVAVAAAMLLTATAAFAQNSAVNKKDPQEEKGAKNYSIPWIATLLGLAAIVAPVAMATRRKWDMPFENDEDEK